MHVLTLGTGPHGILAVSRSLARQGVSVTLGIPDGMRCPSAMTRYARGVVRVPDPEGSGFAPFLGEWLAQNPVDVVLPLNDVWLRPLALHADALRPLAALAMAPAEAVMWALDKERTVAEWPNGEHPLPPPLTVAAADLESALAAWTYGFPAVVKPRSATGADGIHLVHDAAELAAAWAEVDRDFPRPLIQEFVDYAPEDKHALLYLFDGEGRLRVRYMHRMVEERRTIRSAGGGRCQGGVSLVWESAFDADLLARGQALLEGMGWRGFAEVECVRARGDRAPRLMEVNARFPGTIGLALGQGVEFALGACQAALGRPIAPQLDVRPGRRGRQDWLTLLGARHWRPLVRALDPRIEGANPLLPELALIRSEAGRLLRKRWPKSRPRSRPVVPVG